MNTKKSFHIVQTAAWGGILGMALAAASLLVCGIWYSWKTGAVFAALFLAAGFVKFRPKYPLGQFLLNAFWGIVCILFSCCIPTVLVTDLSYLNIGSYRIVMNFICAAAVYGICLVMTGKIKSAVFLASGLPADFVYSQCLCVPVPGE